MFLFKFIRLRQLVLFRLLNTLDLISRRIFEFQRDVSTRVLYMN